MLSQSFILILLFFVIMILALDTILASKTPSVITNDHWVTIVPTYFAGTLGGLVALIGIWWQLDHEKRDKAKRVKEYISYILKENKNIPDIITGLISVEQGLSYTRTWFVDESEEFDQQVFIEFNQNYLNDNIDTILSLEKGKEILSVNQKINNLNKLYNKSMKTSIIKKEMLKQLKSIDISLKTANLIESYSTFTDNIDFAPSLCLKKLKAALSDHNLSEIMVDMKEFKEYIDSIDPDSLDNSEKILETLSKLNLKFYYLIREVLLNFERSDDQPKQLIYALSLDINFSGQSLDLYKEIKLLSEEFNS